MTVSSPLVETRATALERRATRQTWLGDKSVIIAAIVVALSIAAIVGFLHHEALPIWFKQSPYLWKMECALWHVSPADKRAMLVAHKTFLVLMGIFTLTWAFLPQRLRSRFAAFESPKLAQLLATGLVGFFIFSYYSSGCWLEDRVAGILGVIAAGLLVHYRSRLQTWIAKAVLVLIIGAATIPGLFLAPDFSNCCQIDVVQSQQHYTVTMLEADRLARGLGIDSQIYGVLPPTLLGAYEKVFGVVSFGQDVHIVQFLQLLMLAVIALSYTKFVRGRAALALFAIMPLLPWYNCRGTGFEFPNHSAWRFLGCVLPLLFLQLAAGLPYRAFGLVCGALSCVSILCNIETGIAATLSIAAMVFFLRSRSGKHGPALIAEMTLPFVLGFSAAIGVYIALFVSLFGTVPSFLDPSYVSHAFHFSSLTSSPGWPSPLGAAIFLHAAYVLLKAARTRPEEINSVVAFRAFLAVFLLIWECYYFVRPYSSNLASIWIFYGPLLIDLLRSAVIAARGCRQVRLAGLIAACFIAFNIVPTVLADYRSALTQYGPLIMRFSRGHFNSRTDSLAQGVSIAGTVLPAELGAYLERKCSLVNNMKKVATLNYLTIYSFIVPKATGVYAKTPFIDPVFGATTEDDHRLLANDLLAGGEQVILIDDQDSDPVLKDQEWFRLFLTPVMRKLHEKYDLSGRTNGWLVYEKRPEAVSPPAALQAH